MQYALDYSAGRPTAAQVLAAGYVGVIRYVGFPANRKCLTAAEYADMVAGGVGVALVFEQTAGDALNGRAAGRGAAKLALAHANDLGFPTATRPIYYACDTDVVTEAQFVAVLDYLRGAGDVHGGPAMVGVYGEADVMERAAAAGVASWFWQTRAWSRGIVSTHDHLLQLVGAVQVGGIDCDRNEIHRPDWGQTGQQQEDDMSAADADRVIAEVRAARDVLYNLTRAQAADGKPDPGHAEQAVTTVNARVSAVAGQVAQVASALAAVGKQVGALSDDEAKILAAVGAAWTDTSAQLADLMAAGGQSEAKLLDAIGQVIANPDVPNDDAGAVGRAVVAELRDALGRGAE